MNTPQVESPWRRTLRSGMKGRDVALLQARLLDLGYYEGEPDGIFGPLTKEALRGLQKAHRLRVDGIAGKEVFAVLRSGQARPEVGHIVSRGETLSTVARLHNVPVELLVRANRLGTVRLRQGQRLAIPVSRLIGYCAGDEDARASMESYERQLGFLSAVAPRWFRVGPDGEVAGEPVKKVSALASLAGIPVLAVVAAGPRDPATTVERLQAVHAVLTDASARRRAIKGIVDSTAASRAHGAILSIGRLSADDSYAFTSFVRSLSRALAEVGRSLAVDVPCPDAASAESPAGPIEYPEIARAASHVIMRLYEEPEDLTAPGPAASPSRARAVLRRVVRDTPTWKLILGVPAFGIDFSCAVGAPAMRKRHSEVAEIIEIFRPSVDRLEPAGSCTFRYRSFRVNHTVVFEDAVSIGEYVDLALRFNLAGLALADLGEEDPEAWDAMKARFKALRDFAPSEGDGWNLGVAAASEGSGV